MEAHELHRRSWRTPQRRPLHNKMAYSAWRNNDLGASCSSFRHPVLHVTAAFTLTDGQRKTITYSKPSSLIGSSSACDIKVAGQQVEEQHASITQKGKLTLLKPLVGEDMLDDSRTWKDGVALRPGVSYLLGSGCKLAFGTPEQAFIIEFDEGTGSNPLMEMMMKGMVASSSSEVMKALGD